MVNGYDIAYKWFDHLKSKGHYIVGYVIMPNHIHALIGFSSSDSSINSIIGNGKRFMAYEMIRRLNEKKEIELLDKLAQAVKKRSKDCSNTSWSLPLFSSIGRNVVAIDLSTKN
jgi:REP element-mobilizing transposase RayT